LEKATAKLKEAPGRPKNEFIRDSAIQRFEFTYELVWKTLKAHLESKGTIAYSPRDNLREAFQQGMIDGNPLWLKTIELRNLTTHTYNEAIAEMIYKTLPRVLALYQGLLEKLKGMA
jgi:nucleotidyltransferase substrate binding protein (TIGR01987 family)